MNNGIRSPRSTITVGRGGSRGRYRRSATTRDRILLAGRTLLAGQGLTGFSMRAVAGSAGVTPAGLLHQFRSKDALLAAVVAVEARRLRADPVSVDGSTIRSFLAFVADGGRTAPVAYALFERLRRMFTSFVPADAALGRLAQLDGAVLAAVLGDEAGYAGHVQAETADQSEQPSCCAPQGRGAFTPGPAVPLTASAPGPHTIQQIAIPAQRFRMGDHHGDGKRGDGETPVHSVSLTAFSIDATSVTNADFARFVAATGYRTEAEQFGFSAVFHLAVAAPADDLMGSPGGTPWWLGVRGADWAHPGGSGSSIDALPDHPVVHVSWNDAQAYCAWAGRALPTEAQWEAASRGGLDGVRYPWGDEREDHRMNIWQGVFPVTNTLEDGYLTTAPVRSYKPNGYGMWQTVGNVWEWCADWFSPDYYTISPEANPPGPPAGQVRVLRGGSYLCHDSYCNRYRNAARSSNTPDSSMGNAGFRTVSR